MQPKAFQREAENLVRNFGFTFSPMHRSGRDLGERREVKGAFKLAMTECKEMVGFGERLDKGRGNCWHTPWRDRGSFSLSYSF